MIGEKVFQYKILEKIGSGGMGEVYLAEDSKLDRKVALKFLPVHFVSDKALKTRFIKEARAAAKLNHPNIITIHEVDEFNGRPFFVMEYVEGNSLADLIGNNGLPSERAIDITLQICEGLKEAHKAGIVHRDIKPSNIIIDHNGRCRILDFGLAAVQSEERLTKTGALLGTVEYMSPEQVRGEKVDHRSDIFSLGILFFELLTGELPFKSDHGPLAVYSILNEPHYPLARFSSDLPGELQRILDLLLEKDKESRYRDLDEMISDLRNLEPISDSGHGPIETMASSPEIEKKSIAVMYFEDFTEDDDIRWLSRGLPHMLITDLEQSRQLDVVSYQRLFDILRLFGKEDSNSINIKTATAVAKRAKASKILTGSIFKSGDNIRIDYQLQEVNSGRLFGAGKVIGKDPLVLADELGGAVRQKLDVSPVTGEIRNIAEVTTNSPEAYRYYLEGVNSYYKYYWEDAIDNFKKAIDHDPSFAIAYSRLAFIKGGFEGRMLINTALKYLNQISLKERFYVQCLDLFLANRFSKENDLLLDLVNRYPEEKEAYSWLGFINHNFLGKTDKAISYLNIAIEIDPLYKDVLNQFADLYASIKDAKRALWAANKYISIAPNEPNPYNTKACLYANFENRKKAIKYFEKALEKKPDYSLSLRCLGDMHILNNDYEKAKICYLKYISSQKTNKDTLGRTNLAFIPIYQGKFKNALEIINLDITEDRASQSEGRGTAMKYLLKMTIYKQLKNFKMALLNIKRAMLLIREYDPDDSIYWRHHYIQLLAKYKHFTEAEKNIRTLKEEIDAKDSSLIYFYKYAAGCLEYERDNLDISLDNFKQACDTAPPFNIWAHYEYAKICLIRNLLDRSEAEFKKIISVYFPQTKLWSILKVKSHYHLARVYEKSGKANKAMEQYEIFLGIWQDADPGIAEVEDSKIRLAKLRHSS